MKATTAVVVIVVVVVTALRSWPGASEAGPLPARAASHAAAEASSTLPAMANSRVGEVHISSRVEPAVATVGDVVVYSVSVSAPGDLVVSVPEFAGALEPFESRGDFVAASAESTSEHAFEVPLASFMTGAQVLPPVEFLVTGPSGEERVIAPAIGIFIRSVLPPGPLPDLRGAKGLLQEPSWLPWWATIGLLAVVAAFLGLYAWSRRAIVGEPVRAEAEVPFDEVAVRELRALAEGPLWPAGEAKEFYVRLSSIVRAYLARRYGFDAVEMTTTELGRALAQRRVDGQPLDLVQRICATADLVKFARIRPRDDEHAACVAATFELFELTRGVGPSYLLAPPAAGQGRDRRERGEA